MEKPNESPILHALAAQGLCEGGDVPVVRAGGEIRSSGGRKSLDRVEETTEGDETGKFACSGWGA
jgi:hypothetical protein